MNPITESEIKAQYQKVLASLCRDFPLCDWATEPTAICLTGRKRCFGMADQRGVIHINRAFIGTQAHRLLGATLRHEFTHLYVGLAQGHNRVFKQWAQTFKANMGAELAAEKALVEQRIGHKFMLWACLENGERCLVKKAHRRSRRYRDYRPTWRRHYRMQGQKVLRFEYEPCEVLSSKSDQDYTEHN